MHDVIGAQQHIAQAVRIGAGQGALFHVLEIAQRGRNHHLRLAQRNLRMGKHAVANEFSDEAGGRPVVQRVGFVPLLQAALVHHADPVADGKRFQLVVGHKQGGGPGGLENAAHFMGQALAQIHIQVGKGLVEQQQPGLGRQRPGQCHTLLLPARELVRMQMAGLSQTHQCQHLLDTRKPLGGRQVRQAKAHIARHVQVRKERVVLKHHADAPRLGRQVLLGAADHVAGQPDAACAGALQSGHGAQQGGLAAARRADQHADLAGLQTERRLIDRSLAAAGILNAELGDIQKHAADCRCLQFSFALTPGPDGFAL